MKAALKITAIVILLILGFFVSLFCTKVILSIAALYELYFITSFSFVQILGLLLIISMVRHKHKKAKDDTTFREDLDRGLHSLLNQTIFILLSWGISFLSYYIIS